MRYLQAEQQMVGMMAEVLDQPLVNCPSYVWQGEKKLHLYLSRCLLGLFVVGDLLHLTTSRVSRVIFYPTNQ
jgi:hypothetical protein